MQQFEQACLDLRPGSGWLRWSAIRHIEVVMMVPSPSLSIDTALEHKVVVALQLSVQYALLVQPSGDGICRVPVELLAHPLNRKSSRRASVACLASL
jgi:hypothetical protein